MDWKTGVDIGSYYIKIIEGGKTKNQKLSIRRIGYLPAPSPGLKENLIEREQDVCVKAIKDFLQEHKISTKRGVLGIGGTGTVIHYFDIPELPKEETESAIQLEMMQVVPGGVKNLLYDYTILPGKNNKKTVLLVGAYKEQCEFLISTIQMAGISPLIMDHNGLAVLNSFRFLHKQQEDIISILNIGYKTTNIALAEKDGFVLVRDIPFGGKNITNTIASERKISQEDAEIYGKKEESKEDIKGILSSDISELITEVKRSIDYFRARTEKTPLTLFLTGGGSLFYGLCDAIEKGIDIKTSIWNPIEEVDTEMPIPLDIKSKGVMFAVAIGLVLREIK